MPSKEFDVRADRKTIFGNPFHIYDESERDAVCDKYAKYFYERTEKNPDCKREADRLVDVYKKYKKLNLFCWCYPKRCHSKTIREYILSIAVKEEFRSYVVWFDKKIMKR